MYPPNSTPLITILSGFYNRASHVKESIESLRNQSYKNIEIILFDDCSTDETLINLMKQAKEDTRISVVSHKENKGFVQGLKDAINLSKGKYIAIHGSGDISKPDRIQKQVDTLESNPNICVTGCYREIEKEKDDMSGHVFKDDVKGDSKDFIIHTNPFSHGEVMFRKDIYDEVGGYRTEFKFAQDRDLWCRMSRLGKLYVIPQVLYIRKFLEDGVGTRPEKLLIQRYLSEIAVQCHESVLSGKPDIIDAYGAHGMLLLRSTRRLSNDLLRYGVRFLRMGEKDTALFFIRRAISVKNSFKSLSYLLIVKISGSCVTFLLKILTQLKRATNN